MATDPEDPASQEDPVVPASRADLANLEGPGSPEDPEIQDNLDHGPMKSLAVSSRRKEVSRRPTRHVRPP